MSKYILLFFAVGCVQPVTEKEFVSYMVDRYCFCGFENCEEYYEFYRECDFDYESATECISQLEFLSGEDYCVYEPDVCDLAC